MKNFKRADFHFWPVAVALLVVTGLLVAAYSPQIKSFQSRVVNHLLHQAQSADSTGKVAYLQAAHTFAPHDPVAIEALAQHYSMQGSDRLVLDLYQSSITQPNQIYLGNLALRLQQYDAALQYFSSASQEQQSAQSLSGEAQVLFNLDKVEQGCKKADSAHKLDLSNAQANGVVQVCKLLRQNANEGSREQANLLLQNQISKIGEKWLLTADPKTPNDLLGLARLAAARGDIKLAITRAEEGIQLNPASMELNQTLAQYYELSGNEAQSFKYKKLYDQLKFSNYQQAL